MFGLIFTSFFLLVQPSFSVDITGENNTIIEALHGNVTAISGQKAILTCIFDTTNQALSHLSNHQLIWIRQNHATYDADLILGHNQDLLISDQRLNIQRTNLDYSLTIVNATVEDEGNYACEINTQPPQRALVHLSIQEIPTITDNTTASPIIINEYDNVTLECYARGRPMPSITWFRRNKDPTSLDNVLLTNDTDGQLNLINITRHQTGFYECQASNGIHGHIANKEVQVHVLFPPTIRAQSATVYGSMGKSVQLQCLATGPFDTKISWERMDNQTMTKIRQQQQITGDLIRTNLYIKDIDKQDLGYYGCIAESMSGKSQAKVELREHRRPIDTSTIEKDDYSTSRIQILKRNKVSEQTTMSMVGSKTSTCSFPPYLPVFLFIQLIFCNFS